MIRIRGLHRLLSNNRDTDRAGPTGKIASSGTRCRTSGVGEHPMNERHRKQRYFGRTAGIRRAAIAAMAALLLAGVMLGSACTREATADPVAQFPDLSQLTLLDSGPFVWTSRGHTQIRFAAINGYVCVFGDTSNPRNVSLYGQELFCDKRIESTPQGNCRYQQITRTSKADKGPFKLDETDGGYCLEQLDGAPPLPVGNRLSSGTITCGVGADFAACVDATGETRHGFVIRPSGNDLF